jgi:hypothetical protein
MTRIGMYKSPAFKVNRIVFAFNFTQTWIIELVDGAEADKAYWLDEPIEKVLSDYGSTNYL